jgi:hypothetical protein
MEICYHQNVNFFQAVKFKIFGHQIPGSGSALKRMQIHNTASFHYLLNLQYFYSSLQRNIYVSPSLFFSQLRRLNVQGKLKSQKLEADEEMRRFQDDLEAQSRTLAMLELEKLDLMEVPVPYIIPNVAIS